MIKSPASAVLHRLRAPFLLLAAGFILAGSAGQGCPPAAPNPPETRLVLGVTENGAFRELADGDEIGVHAGSQGGFHIFLTLRLEGMSTTGPLLVAQDLTLQDTAEEAAPDLEILVSSFQDGDGFVERPDYLLVLSGTQDSLRNRLVDVSMTVRDSGNTFSTTDQVTLRFVDAP